MAALLPYLRLLRAGALFSPAADVLAGACVRGLPLGGAVWWAMAASVSLYGAGMVLNDFADRELDRRQRPERPLPRGEIRPATALCLGLLLLATGVLMAPNRLHHGTMALLVLLYDFGSKRAVVLAALTMAALRGLNLLAAASIPLAAADGTAAYGFDSTALVAALCYAVYILAVTILGIFEDSTSVRPRAVAAVQTAPLLAALIGLATVQGGPWPAPAIALPFVFGFARRNQQTRVWDQAAIRRSMTMLLLGTMLYSALLCVAAGRPAEATAIALCIPLARVIARRISLT